MANLPRDQLGLLVKVLGMLGSGHDGERAAAALPASAILKSHGVTWSDIIPLAPAPAGDDLIDLDTAPDDDMADAELRAYARAFLAGNDAGAFDLGDTRFMRDLVRARWPWSDRQRTGFLRSLRRAWWIRGWALERAPMRERAS